eukprot:scaffold4362_cov390-Prasinococcus_capsulatus_cf.AAC.1
MLPRPALLDAPMLPPSAGRLACGSAATIVCTLKCVLRPRIPKLTESVALQLHAICVPRLGCSVRSLPRTGPNTR